MYLQIVAKLFVGFSIMLFF